MFCNQCNQPISEKSAFCSHCGAKVIGKGGAIADTGKEGILAAIAEALTQYSQLNLVRGQKTDIEINSTLADANWTVGKKKVSYSACVLADAASRRIIFWEMIKETGCGLGPIFSFMTEIFRSNGKTLSGNIKERAYGLNGKVIDYQWDYSRIRHIIESVAKAKGWQFKTVLFKGKATY